MRSKCKICNTRHTSSLPPEMLRGDEKHMCLTCSVVAMQLRALREIAEEKGVKFDTLLQYLQEHPNA